MPSSGSSAPVCRRTGRSKLGRLDARGETDLGVAQLDLPALAGPVRVPLAGHRLHVTIPLEVEGLEAEADRAAAPLPGPVVRRVPTDGLDLTVAVPGVLFSVE